MITAFVEHYLVDEGRSYFPIWIAHVKELLESNKDAISFNQVFGVNVQNKLSEQNRTIIEVKFRCLESLTNWVATEEHAEILDLLSAYVIKHRETNIYDFPLIQKSPEINNDAYLTFEAPEKFGSGLVSQNAVMRTMSEPVPIGIGKLKLASHSSAPLDTHLVKEAWMVAGGKGKVTVNGVKEFTIEAGDIVVFDENESHILTNHTNETMSLFSVWWD